MESYTLTPKAEADLESIWKYGAVTWGVAQAGQYIDDLDNAFNLIAASPLIGRNRAEFKPPVRIYCSGSHCIIYIKEDGFIVIIRVLHKSMALSLKLDEAKR